MGKHQVLPWLVAIGLTPNKTKTIGPIAIPKKYFFDFLRGHFDSDGSVYSYFDPRWKNSFLFYLTFVSASDDHIFWLRQQITDLLNVSGAIYLQNSARYLRFAKTEAMPILDSMYRDPLAPRLTRKYEKVLRIINQAQVRELVYRHA